MATFAERMNSVRESAPYVTDDGSVVIPAGESSVGYAGTYAAHNCVELPFDDTGATLLPKQSEAGEIVANY